MPELLTRRSWLLTAIRDTGKSVSTHAAEQMYAGSPWPTTGRNTARKDLRALARRGHLTSVSEQGRTVYVLASIGGGR